MWHACGISSALPWVFGGVLYTAQMGINYKNYKKGKMDKKTFQRSASLGAVQTVSGIGCASGGAAVGFAVGSVAGPPGMVIGTIVGGIMGGIGGRKLGKNVYVEIEAKI